MRRVEDAFLYTAQLTLRGRGLAQTIASLVPTARFAQPIGALIMYPMMAISGLFAPVDSLPLAVQTVAKVLPLTYAVSLLEGIWKGDAWWAHARDLTALALAFILCTALSAKVFRWE